MLRIRIHIFFIYCVINALLQYFFKCVSILSIYQSTHNSFELYTLYRELTVIKQSSYPTDYVLGLMVQVKIELTVQRYICSKYRGP